MPTYRYELTFQDREYLERVLDDYEIIYKRINTPFVCSCKEDWTDGTNWCDNCGCIRNE